jgi:hypothetical protein
MVVHHKVVVVHERKIPKKKSLAIWQIVAPGAITPETFNIAQDYFSDICVSIPAARRISGSGLEMIHLQFFVLAFQYLTPKSV